MKYIIEILKYGATFLWLLQKTNEGQKRGALNLTG